MKTTRKNKGLYTIQFIILSLLMSVIIISCGGCKGSKVVIQTDSKGQTVDSSVSINVQQIPNQEKEVYFFQDHPVLAKLKLKREPKAEIIIEDPQNGERVISHMFDENGKYLGVFDYEMWEKKDETDEFINKYFTNQEGTGLFSIKNKDRTIIWSELQKLRFNVSKRDYDKANYISGYGLKIDPQPQMYIHDRIYNLFVGTRRLEMAETEGYGIWAPKRYHQTYLFDYKGNLIKIYDYKDIGQDLVIIGSGKYGFSSYIDSYGDYEEFKFYRFHDFERQKNYDLNPFEIKNKLDIDHSLRDSDFIDMNENYVFMVYPTFTKTSERKDNFLILVFDLKSDLVYYKYFDMKTKPDMEWKFFTKPDGSKIDLSEFDSLKYK